MLVGSFTAKAARHLPANEQQVSANSGRSTAAGQGPLSGGTAARLCPRYANSLGSSEGTSFPHQDSAGVHLFGSRVGTFLMPVLH